MLFRSRLRVRSWDALVGRVDLLEADAAIEHWRRKGIDLSNVLRMPDVPEGTPLRRVQAPSGWRASTAFGPWPP